MDCRESAAIIVAAGTGVRMNSPVPKQYLLLRGQPVLSHTLSVFEKCLSINRIYLVIPRSDFDYVRQNILQNGLHRKEIFLTAGGADRQDSVFKGLCALKTGEKYVVVHDGVRPFVLPENIEDCLAQARRHGACTMGLAAKETVKQVDAEHFVQKTLRRDAIWMAQTPQAFQRDLLQKAHQRAISEKYRGTDDASLVENMKGKVKIIPGNVYNIKITTPEDLALAEIIMKCRGSQESNPPAS